MKSNRYLVYLKTSCLILVISVLLAFSNWSTSFAGECHYNNENRNHNYQHHVFETGSTRNQVAKSHYQLESRDETGKLAVYDCYYYTYEKQVIYECVCGAVDEKWVECDKYVYTFLYYK